METSPVLDPGVFPTTRWSMVASADARDPQQGRDTLDLLLRRYLPVLRTHLIMDHRLSDDSADDVLQGFVSDKIVERNIVALADRKRGKFRTFLVSSLDHYCIDKHRADSALKRQPVERYRSLDAMSSLAVEPEVADARDAGFDVDWARQVLRYALDRMRDECRRTEQSALWILFDERILRPAFEGVEPTQYEHLVERLNLQSPTQAANLLVTAKRMLVRNLKAVIGEYGKSQEEIEEELRDLREILSTCGG